MRACADTCCHRLLYLGLCYKEGDGVTKDANQAREWHTKAVAQGYAKAQTELDRLDRLNASN